MERSPAATGNLAYRLSPRAEREPGRVALIDLGDGERISTCGDLDVRIDRVAGLLRAAGIEPGERVILALGNRTVFLEAMFGVMRAGAVPVPLDTRLGPLQLAHCVADAAPTGAILEPELVPSLPGLLSDRSLRLCLASGEPPPGFDRFEPAVASVAVGSAPVSDALFEAMVRAFPKAFVYRSYGSTEGGPVMLGPPLDGPPIPPGSCGVPWPECEVRLVDALGRGADRGELGVRNPGVTPGYRNPPELDRERIVEGWLRTGDLFRRDDQGFFFFLGRTDHMFVCGGENIDPIEVESPLLRHPAVSEACVVPIPWGDEGEAPAAMVSLVPGAIADEAAPEAHCLAHGPAYAHLRRIVIVDELPLTGARKIDRHAIAARLRERCVGPARGG